MRSASGAKVPKQAGLFGGASDADCYRMGKHELRVLEVLRSDPPASMGLERWTAGGIVEWLEGPTGRMEKTWRALRSLERRGLVVSERATDKGWSLVYWRAV